VQHEIERGLTVAETLHEDFVRTARAKGAGEARVLRLHVLPSATLRMLTMVGMEIGTAIGVTEDADTDFEPDDPRFEYGVLYSWLTQVHFELVTVLLDEIGEAGTDDPGATGA